MHVFNVIYYRRLRAALRRPVGRNPASGKQELARYVRRIVCYDRLCLTVILRGVGADTPSIDRKDAAFPCHL